MGKTKNLVLVVSLTVAALVSLTLLEDGALAQSRKLSIGTADTAGVYYILGGGIAKLISSSIPNTQATAEVTPGAAQDIIGFLILTVVVGLQIVKLRTEKVPSVAEK